MVSLTTVGTQLKVVRQYWVYLWLDGTLPPPQAHTTDEGQKQERPGGEDSSSTEVQEEVDALVSASHSHSWWHGSEIGMVCVEGPVVCQGM